MRVDLLAVGTELLLGDIVNGNAAWLGRRLADAGIDVGRSVVVGDEVDVIAAALRDALAVADAVVVTGGLGPTHDDLTRDAVAALAGVALRREPALVQGLRDRYAALGRQMPARNLVQADLPEGATALPNDRGTAPGIRLVVDDRAVYAMPGVPHEMEAMFTTAVLPDLLARAGRPAAIVSRVIHTAGVYESVLAEALADVVTGLDAAGNPTLAFLPAGGRVRLRLTAHAADRAAADALISPVEKEIRRVLGEAVYGVDGDTLDGAVHRLLATAGATVASAESLTGGGLGAALTEMPGSSTTFRGGVVSYATDLKRTLLDVPADALAGGAVSAEVAVAMADGVRRRLGATYGLSTTGVAGPDPQDGQPVGTVFVGLAGPGGHRVRPLRLSGDRERVRGYTVVAALDLLRRHLEFARPWDAPR